MSHVQQSLLYECDESGRTPLYICTHVKPRIEVLTFLRRQYPMLLDAPAGGPAGSRHSYEPDDKHRKSKRRKRFSPLAAVKSIFTSLWADFLLLVSARGTTRRNTYRTSQSISAEVSSAAQAILSAVSGAFGKKNVEFSKLPFRSNILSCGIILYYILIFIKDFFVGVVLESRDDGAEKYSTLALLAVNIVGWMCMCGSFFVIYFTPPQRMPAECTEGYTQSLKDIVHSISEISDKLVGGDDERGRMGVLRGSSEDSVPCTGGLFLPSSAIDRPLNAPLSRERPYVCHRCRCRLPLRSGHCKELDQCVMLYDHYCYFVWSCIHRDNYIYFFFYILSVSAYLPIFMYSAKIYARAVRPTSHFLLYFNIWVCLVWLWVVCLTGYQVQSLCLGATTRERMKQPGYTAPSNPFHSGNLFGNISRYFKNTNFDMTCIKFRGESRKKREGYVDRQIYFSRAEALRGMRTPSNLKRSG